MTLFGALLLAGCQNELYTESQKITEAVKVHTLPLRVLFRFS